jgi:hypothetical protein
MASEGVQNVKDASIEELLEVAKDVLDEVANRSTIFDPSLEASLPRFEERGEHLSRWNDMRVYSYSHTRTQPNFSLPAQNFL